LFLIGATFLVSTSLLNLDSKSLKQMKNRKKTFLQVPQILGGSKVFKMYIEENLVYPPEAKEKRIEGIVHLVAEIDDNGNVVYVEILHGLGGGCNEEAIRLINGVRFGTANNKGIRLKTKKQFRIKFQIPPENKINYQLVSQSKETNQKEIGKKYSYTISIT
jgi:TonB family protein